MAEILITTLVCDSCGVEASDDLEVRTIAVGRDDGKQPGLAEACARCVPLDAYEALVKAARRRARRRAKEPQAVPA